MKFGLFYEIPVPRPWNANSERVAFENVIEQAVLGDKLGFHSFWTVEHHFLDEFSHCSSPGVLYGAIAAKTENIRIGHGVRLTPFPYNHPIRAAEMAATVDILSNGRLEFGTGRSATRAEIEGFGIAPDDTRPMWSEALDIIHGAWTKDEFEWDGEYFKFPRRRVIPKPVQQPHPPMWAASSSSASHEIIGEKGLGLLSFTVGMPPENLVGRIERYREGMKRVPNTPWQINNQVATFTQVHCADRAEDAYADAGDSMAWYVQTGLKAIADMASWQEHSDLGTYEYARKLLGGIDLNTLTFDYMHDVGAVVVGDPDECIRNAKRYEEAGTDLLLCLVQPHKIPHEKVMRSIELLGKHVLPAFS